MKSKGSKDTNDARTPSISENQRRPTRWKDEVLSQMMQRSSKKKEEADALLLQLQCRMSGALANRFPLPYTQPPTASSLGCVSDKLRSRWGVALRSLRSLRAGPVIHSSVPFIPFVGE